MSRSLCGSWFRHSLCGVAVLAISAIGVGSASAIVLLDDDFSSGYVDGLLRFQSPNGPGNGTWLGQTTEIDATAGIVQGRGGGFLRNGWNLGATGTLLGGPASPDREVGNGFLQGDVIRVASQYSFTLPSTNNTGVYNFGVTDCFAECGFSPAPRAGIETGWNNFAQGTYKVFTNYGRDSNVGLDNPFGIILDGADIGIENGVGEDQLPNGLPEDLVSDVLLIEYSAQLTDAANDVWTSTELVITNVTTNTVLVTASVDQPAALETWVWNSTGVDDEFTDAIETGMAGHPTAPGSDMWFGGLWVPNSNPAQETNVESVFFEYIANIPPLDGDYNGDGFVNAADYTVWRDTEGSMGADLAADGTGDDLLGVPDLDVDDFDRQFWAANYGATVFGGTATATPEPTTAVLLLVGLAGLSRRRLG